LVVTACVLMKYQVLVDIDRVVSTHAVTVTEQHRTLEQFLIAVGFGTYPMVLRATLVPVGLAYAWRRRWDLALFFVLVPTIELLIKPDEVQPGRRSGCVRPDVGEIRCIPGP
jgi:hypothetical protein